MIKATHIGKRFRTACIVAVFLITLVMPGFSRADDLINYRLKWLINASVVGDVYAEIYEYFKTEGLSVKVKAGGPERDAIRELELGYAQFGVASADQVIRAVSKGASVVVLAQLFQVNPMQWIFRPDDITIKTLDDLKGRTVGITYGGNDETIMKTMLKGAGILEDQVNLKSVRYDYTPFYKKKIEIWPVYRNTQGIFISQKLEGAGERTAFLNPYDFGVRFVANSVVTSEKMVKKHPQTVKKFMRALLSAWTAALDQKNRDKAIAAIRRYDRDSSMESLNLQLDATKQMIQPKSDVAIGTIDVDAWQQTETIMLDQKLISKPVDIGKRLHLNGI